MIYLPPHKISLHLNHNQHKAYYETVESYLVTDDGRLDFRSDKERQACIDTNEIWELQWYPDTPIGFYAIAAPTLEALIEYSEEFVKELHS